MSKSRALKRQAERRNDAPISVSRKLVPAEDLSRCQKERDLYKKATGTAMERTGQMTFLLHLQGVLGNADLASYGAFLIARVVPKTKIAHHLREERFREKLFGCMEQIEYAQRADPDHPPIPRDIFNEIIVMHDRIRGAIIAGEQGDYGEALRALNDADGYYSFAAMLEEVRGRRPDEPRAYVMSRLAGMRDAADSKQPDYLKWFDQIEADFQRPDTDLTAEEIEIKKWFIEQRNLYKNSPRGLRAYLKDAVSDYRSKKPAADESIYPPHLPDSSVL